MCINDSVALEKRGIPTATICAGNFARLGQIEAKGLGFPSLPIIVAPYPFYSLSNEKVREAADRLFNEIVHILTQPAEKSAEEYRDRHTLAPRPVEFAGAQAEKSRE